MINKISDNKKFWLITILYLSIFWILPLQPLWFYSLFQFTNNLLEKININIESIILYFLVIIPIVILFCYLFIKKLQVKYKNIIFILMYILLTYIPLVAYFLNGLSKISIRF